jgi:hypothetical protein
MNIGIQGKVFYSERMSSTVRKVEAIQGKGGSQQRVGCVVSDYSRQWKLKLHRESWEMKHLMIVLLSF